MEIVGRELAPVAMVELIEHYAERLTLEIKRVIFIDDYESELTNAYEQEEKELCFNFAKLPIRVRSHGWGNLMFHAAMWAVQISAVLEVIRIAVQEQYFGFEKMDEEELDHDIDLFIGQELQSIAAKSPNLFMPEKMEEMGIIGQRIRNILNDEFDKGGARIDLAAWTCGGAVDTNEFRNFVKGEFVDNLQKEIVEGKMGVAHEGMYFLTIAEFLSLTCEDSCLTEDALDAACRMSERLGTALEHFDDDVHPGMAGHATEVIEEGTVAPAEEVEDRGVIAPSIDLDAVAAVFKDINQK